MALERFMKASDKKNSCPPTIAWLNHRPSYSYPIYATFLLDILTKLGEVIRHKTYTTFVSPFTTLVVNLWCFNITNQIIKVKRWLTFIPVSAPYI